MPTDVTQIGFEPRGLSALDLKHGGDEEEHATEGGGEKVRETDHRDVGEVDDAGDGGYGADAEDDCADELHEAGPEAEIVSVNGAHLAYGSPPDESAVSDKRWLWCAG